MKFKVTKEEYLKGAEFSRYSDFPIVVISDTVILEGEPVEERWPCKFVETVEGVTCKNPECKPTLPEKLEEIQEILFRFMDKIAQMEEWRCQNAGYNWRDDVKPLIDYLNKNG